MADEKLILAKRQHWIVLVKSISAEVFLYLALYTLASLLLVFLYPFEQTFLILTLFLLSILFSLIAKNFVDWYYHFYIITNRKIMEVQYIPFFTDTINNVFLDQVRTTEIDVIVNNFIKQVLNIGDVTIAFDRPSHDSLFVLKDISSPRVVADILCNELQQLMEGGQVWFQKGQTNSFVKLNEDVFSAKGV